MTRARPDRPDRSDLQIRPYERREARVRAWDPRTVEVAATIADMVRRRLPDLVVEHIGSTAVPGLPGKGIVDLSVEVQPSRIPSVVEVLYGLGFGPQPGPDPWPPTRPMLVGAVNLEGDEFRVHLHVQPIGGDMARDVAFRDALRSDPELKRQYTELKSTITGGDGIDTLRYTHSKTSWILGVYKALGFRIPAIQPPATIGILGGGALGRDLALAAHELGYAVAVLDPDPQCPAAAVADRLEVGPTDDVAHARRLAAGCAVVTQALEDVSLEVVRSIDDGRVAIRPGPYALRLTHDPGAVAQFLEANRAVAARDGDAAGSAVELLALLARGVDGVIATFSLARIDRHRGPEATIVPAEVAPSVADEAAAVTADLATGMGLIGVLATELVLGRGGRLLVRGLTPGVHELGSWTRRGAVTSQFEQHIRAICGLALGSTELRAGAVRPAAD